MPMLQPLPTSPSRLDRGWVGKAANESRQRSLPVGFFPLPPAGGSGLFSPESAVKHDSHGQPEKWAEIEKPAHRPYAGFGLSFLVHGFALFGVAVTLPQPEAPPGTLAITLTPAANPEEKLAPHASPPVNTSRPPIIRKLLVAKPDSHRPAMTSQADTPVDKPAPAAEAPLAPAAPPAMTSTTATHDDEATKEEVTPPLFAAAYLRNPAPAYPAPSRRLGEEGRVLLRVHVQADGQADEVVLHQSSNYSRLDEAAIESVRHWQFVPARAGGAAIAAWVIVPIQFNLRGVG